MSCQALERWLDDGRPAAQARSRLAHAASCPRCRGLLDADGELQRRLERPPAAAPAALVSRVMARIEAAPRPAPARPWAPPSASSGLPWWVSLAAEPVTAMALILAALLGAGAGALGTGGRVLFAWLAPLLSAAAPESLAPGRLAPSFGPLLAIGLLPPIALASRELFLWSRRLASRQPAGARR